MDYLDSLDLYTTNKKSNRMRSWYLYEQYKSLERNQLEATQKLRDRSYQEKILRRELTERKARRNLYDKFGVCQSESRLDKCIKSTEAFLTKSAGNDFTDDFSEYKDDQVLLNNEPEISEDGFSQDDSIPEKRCIDDFQSIEDLKNDNSYTESVKSVMENVASNETICGRVREEIELARKDIADDLSKQLGSVQENIEFLEYVTKMQDVDKSSELGGLNLVEKCDLKKENIEEINVDDTDPDNNIIMMWSRLVSFAYQVIQLNRGNCYYDYSSQFLTAVLACDVLRRGVNRMCHILQPYVSPIKFDDWDACGDCYKNVKRKKSVQAKKSKKNFDFKLYPRKSRNIGRLRNPFRKYSDECWCWQHYDRSLYGSRSKAKRRYTSEPQHTYSIAKNHFDNDLSSQRSTSSSDSLWPMDLKTSVSNNLCSCCRCKKEVNPMLKIARYIDSILQDVDESKHM